MLYKAYHILLNPPQKGPLILASPQFTFTRRPRNDAAEQKERPDLAKLGSVPSHVREPAHVFLLVFELLGIGWYIAKDFKAPN